jgi:hypothetical protein
MEVKKNMTRHILRIYILFYTRILIYLRDFLFLYLTYKIIRLFLIPINFIDSKDSIKHYLIEKSFYFLKLSLNRQHK